MGLFMVQRTFDGSYLSGRSQPTMQALQIFFRRHAYAPHCENVVQARNAPPGAFATNKNVEAAWSLRYQPNVEKYCMWISSPATASELASIRDA